MAVNDADSEFNQYEGELTPLQKQSLLSLIQSYIRDGDEVIVENNENPETDAGTLSYEEIIMLIRQWHNV